MDRLHRPVVDFGSLFARSPLPAWIYDVATLQFLSVNDAALRTYGYSRQRFLRMSLFDLRFPEDTDEVVGFVNGVFPLDDAATRREGMRHRTALGDELFVRVIHSDVIPFDGHRARIAIAVDVTDWRAANRGLAASRAMLAYIDPVVGLPNRAALAEALDEKTLPPGSVVFAVRLAYAIVHEHEVALAEEVARAAARTLREVLPDTCTLFAHSTDVVIVVCPPVDDPRLARTWAELIVSAFIAPLAVGDGVVVNARVGFDVAAEETPARAMLSHALTALQRTRAASTLISAFTPDMQAAAVRADAIERNLRKAARSEFRLVYQPVVSLRTGALAGVEALLRWRSPELGDVSPSEFIPVAEQSGFIGDIGARVIDMATEQYAAWDFGGGRRPKLMLNVSAQQLRSPLLGETLIGAVERTGMEMTDIDLELTETAMIEQLGAGIEALVALRRRGVRICIDDFGMGYSSLSYLTDLPLDVLKIDRSFVSGMRSDPVKNAVVSAVIGLAHTIGATAIGEGVEHAAEADLLRSLDCDAMQGFWIARPMPSLPRADQFATR